MKTNGNHPISPSENVLIKVPGKRAHQTCDGLTKREFFAALMLQGIVTATAEAWTGSMNTDATNAVNLADALIEALNTPVKEQEGPL